MKKRILIVDDEADFVFFLRANLEALGKYEVDAALSGKEALAIFSRTEPDLVLLDIVMPEMDGIKLLLKLKKTSKADKRIPVVMLSAKRDTASFFQAQRYGAVDYLMKPVPIQTLTRLIDKYLRIYSEEKAPLPIEEKHILTKEEILKKMRSKQLQSKDNGNP